MPNGKSDIMAQAVYLAQLSAAEGHCECDTCQILRKATQEMKAKFLQGTGINPASVEGAVKVAKKLTGEVVKLDEEDE